MLNIPLSISQMEQIAADAALPGITVDGDHATVDAGLLHRRPALVAFHRESGEQAAPAVREALA